MEQDICLLAVDRDVGGASWFNGLGGSSDVLFISVLFARLRGFCFDRLRTLVGK